jgi:hypothetical protein
MKELPVVNSDRKIILDDDWAEKLKNFHFRINGRGYPDIFYDGKKTCVHRIVMNASVRDEIDHINRNRLDCRRENLRFCTHSQNLANNGPHKNNKLGIKGVDQIKTTMRYRASIRINYKKIHLGMFEKLRDAAEAYNNAADKYFGDFAYHNDLEAIHD